MSPKGKHMSANVESSISPTGQNRLGTRPPRSSTKVTLYRPPFVRDALFAGETDRQAVLEAKRAEKANGVRTLVEFHWWCWQTYEEANLLLRRWGDVCWPPHNHRQAHQLPVLRNGAHRLEGGVKMYGLAVRLCFNPAGKDLVVIARMEAKRTAFNERLLIGNVAG
jgi:hypothetical protein